MCVCNESNFLCSLGFQFGGRIRFNFLSLLLLFVFFVLSVAFFMNSDLNTDNIQHNKTKSILIPSSLVIHRVTVNERRRYFSSSSASSSASSSSSFSPKGKRMPLTIFSLYVSLLPSCFLSSLIVFVLLFGRFVFVCYYLERKEMASSHCAKRNPPSDFSFVDGLESMSSGGLRWKTSPCFASFM